MPRSKRLSERWTVVLTTPQLRAAEFALFALVDGAKPGELERLGYSLYAAKRAHMAIQKAQETRS